MPGPLILSSLPHDIHAAAVCWGLRQAGLEPQWIPGWHAIAPSLEISGDAPLHAGPWLQADPPRSIWFRRPAPPATLPGVAAADAEFVGGEWRRFAGNLYATASSLDGAFWVNPPDAALRAEHKLVQLQAAAGLGLPFPATLASADPARIRAFVERHGDVVHKPFQTHTWQDADGRLFSSYARRVDAGMLGQDASLRLCPGIYQRAVDKAFDVRVTLVGRHAFAVRLDTPPQGDVVDWRSASLSGRVAAGPIRLPPEWERGLLGLAGELGLVLGCIDLVVDRAGGWHFIEINQAGQFLFLEQAVPGTPLLRALCALLAEARADCSLDTIPAHVDYRRYLDSSEYAEWWREAGAALQRPGRALHGVSREAAATPSGG